jgi:Fanconi anemia group M protein
MFYNIFSNKIPEQEQNKAPIIIDTREKQSLIASLLRERKANIKFETLEIADYLINNIAIERKTYSDFISSMINKRLFTQLDNIKKYPKHFLIIEGKTELSNNLKKASQGMILSIITSLNIPIIFTENQEETADYLILLAKQQEKQNKEQPLRYTPSNLTEKEQKQFILEGFSGIGPVTAKKLLKQFGSIRNIINAEEKELKEVLGIKYEKFKQLRG